MKSRGKLGLLGASILVMAIMVLASCGTGPVETSTPISPTETPLCDCFCEYRVSAWLDENENGSHDPEEHPVEGMTFYIEVNGQREYGHEETDSEGYAELSLASSNCECLTSWTFAVEFKELAGYSLVSRERDDSEGWPYLYSFGFQRVQDPTNPPQ